MSFFENILSSSKYKPVHLHHHSRATKTTLGSIKHCQSFLYSVDVFFISKTFDGCNFKIITIQNWCHTLKNILFFIKCWFHSIITTHIQYNQNFDQTELYQEIKFPNYFSAKSFNIFKTQSECFFANSFHLGSCSNAP